MAVTSTDVSFGNPAVKAFELPLEEAAAAAERYCPDAVTVTLYGSDLVVFLQRLRDGLVDGSGTLASGKAVATAADAAQWLLEQVEGATD